MALWDIFCIVVDNYGDIGTCWRLARQLATEYQLPVRLWVDRLDSLQALCPSASTVADIQTISGVEIRRWAADFPTVDVADVVIEAFGCTIPATYAQRMKERTISPVWINLEYLSAEDWIEESHLLPSPQSVTSLKKHFFFPGFTRQTGGLIRERNLRQDCEAFEPTCASAFLSSIGVECSKNSDELLASLFCYENPGLSDLLEVWSNNSFPIKALVFPGPAVPQISRFLGLPLQLGDSHQRGTLTLQKMPFLSQQDYDRLLWACDLNFVRGEDSFVRAQWATRPFVWQIYPQSENAHHRKLDSFLSKYLADLPNSAFIKLFWQAWNGMGDVKSTWSDFSRQLPLLRQYGATWADQLDQPGNLANNLVLFATQQSGSHS